MGRRGYLVTTTERSQPTEGPRKVTLRSLLAKYSSGEPLAMVTAYDYPTGLTADRSHADMVLVGDSLANVALGLDSTAPLTVWQMIHHAKAVMRGTKRAFVVGDLPFGSYHESVGQAIRTGIQMVKETGVDAVKLEGARPDVISGIMSAGITVFGHIGLTPQTASQLSGFRVQGKSAGDAVKLLRDALEIEKAGASMLVLEAIPDVVGTEITKRLSIPTIGIGAGSGCSGQVLVASDLLGLLGGRYPKFSKEFRSLSTVMVEGVNEYVSDVKSRRFPAEEHSYAMSPQNKTLFDEALVDVPAAKGN